MKLMVALGVIYVLGFWFLETEALPAVQTSGDKYTTRYDYVDVDAILKSSRLLRSYMSCVLDRGPCTREGQELRKHLPDAIQTECSKCSPKQKQWAGKIMANLLQHHKNYWNELLTKYDQDGSFKRKFEFEDDDEDEGEER